MKEILDEFGDDAYKYMDKAVTDVSEEATKKLQEVRSFAPGGHPTGVYSRDWTHVKTLGGETRLSTTEKVYNADHYRLNHLLEHGHKIKYTVAQRGGGRKVIDTGKTTPAYPHIKPVEEWAINELQDRVRKEIEGMP